VILFEKTPILCALAGGDYENQEVPSCNQMNLFD